MKSKKTRILVTGLAAMVLSVSSVFAAGVTKNVKVNWNSLAIYVNGKKITGDNIVYNGITYVPLKSISSGLNKNAVYDGKTKKVTINDKEKLYTKKELDTYVSNAEKELESVYNDLGFVAWEFDYYETTFNYYTNNNSDFKLAVMDLQYNSGANYTEIRERIDGNLTSIKSYLDYSKENKEVLKEVFESFGGNPLVIENIITKLDAAYNESLTAVTVLENIKNGQETNYGAVDTHLVTIENNASSVANDIFQYNELLHESIAYPVEVQGKVSKILKK